MTPTFVFLPPQAEMTKLLAIRLRIDVPGLEVLESDDLGLAADLIVNADAAFGYLPPKLLAKANRLRWLQAHQAAPPPGYYYPELVAHPVVVTNFREIYNDHLGAHIMALVLAFARDFQTYPASANTWKPPARHRRRASSRCYSSIVGLGGIARKQPVGVGIWHADHQRRWRRADKPDCVTELYRQRSTRSAPISLS